MVEFVNYDGKWPNLCSGTLVLKIDGVLFNNKALGRDHYCCLCSGGSVVGGPPDWDFEVEYGPWTISGLPEEYAHLQDEIERVINENVTQGCCGGCI